jgi:hypothetical protein
MIGINSAIIAATVIFFGRTRSTAPGHDGCAQMIAREWAGLGASHGLAVGREELPSH